MAALADWDPGDGHKMHYPQLPQGLVNPGQSGMDVAFQLGRLADDWLCPENGYVNDIHFWVSWQRNMVQPINGFSVRIWSGNLDELLWERDFGPGEFVVRDMVDHDQDWYNPSPLEYYLDDHVRWQQINIFNIQPPFFQEAGNRYWLEIDMWGADSCGWKASASNLFGGGGVYWWGDQWNELINVRTGQLLDLAFVITFDCEQRFDFGWEDFSTVFGMYGDGTPPIIATNVGAPDPVYSGLRSLRLEDASPSGTPQAYLAWVQNLQDGDYVLAGFQRYDVTPGAAPSCRIWAHWNDTDSCGGYNGSASGNPDYGPGTGWDNVGWCWTVSGGHTGLIIECRIYSSAGDVVWIDDLLLCIPSHATVQLPNAEPTAVEPTTWGRLKAFYR
jgi:hypothetical protein